MYAEHAPPRSLAPLIECFWTIRSAGRLRETVRYRVLPDGCMDFIFDLGEPLPGMAADRRPASYVVGTMPTALVVSHRGRLDLLGVRFRPGGATPVTGVPACHLAGQVVSLDDLIENADALEDRLREAGSGAGSRASVTGRRLALLTRVLSARLAGRSGPDPRVLAAVALIERRGGGIAVGELTGALGTGRRWLERAFAREVGCSPGEACAVARFRNAVARIDAVPGLALARAAVLAGYYDQAHMTREFRRLAGLPPGALRRERRVASVQDSLSLR